tara:strand:- start:114 stop:305 length:192 start_codon:yes stop_codon:yes gene_type:complete
MDDLLTTSQVAKLAGVSTRTVRNWAELGKLRAGRTAGGHRRFKREEVEKMIKDKDVPRDGVRY